MAYSRPYSPYKLRQEFRGWAANPHQTDIGEGRMKALLGHLNKLTHGDENRRLVLGWLLAADETAFTPISSKRLSIQQWMALDTWISPRQNPDTQKWEPGDYVETEALWVLHRAYQDYHRLTREREMRIQAELGYDEKDMPDPTEKAKEFLDKTDLPPQPSKPQFNF